MLAVVRKESARHRVAVLALPPVVAFDLTIATHVFGHEGEGRYEITLCSVRTGSMHTTTPGFDITVPAGLAALDDAHTVIVPGFARGPAPRTALRALRAAHERGARIASICTGAFALAQAGLLDGLRATTHWYHAAALAREHPAVTVDPTVLYVDEGSVLTSAGLAAGIDLGLHMIERDFGSSAALGRARSMVMPLHRAGGQAQFIPAGTGEAGSPLTDLITWADEHLDQPLTIADLARRALMSPSSLHRAFVEQLGTSPRAWLTTRRLRAACALLEDPAVTIEEAARRSGLGGTANLRLHFRRLMGTTPTAYRQAFAPSGTLR